MLREKALWVGWFVQAAKTFTSAAMDINLNNPIKAVTFHNLASAMAGAGTASHTLH